MPLILIFIELYNLMSFWVPDSYIKGITQSYLIVLFYNWNNLDSILIEHKTNIFTIRTEEYWMRWISFLTSHISDIPSWYHLDTKFIIMLEQHAIKLSSENKNQVLDSIIFFIIIFTMSLYHLWSSRLLSIEDICWHFKETQYLIINRDFKHLIDVSFSQFHHWYGVWASNYQILIQFVHRFIIILLY